MTKIKINPNPIEPYKILYDLPKDTWLVINIGGRGGGKSYETSKFATIQAIQNNKRIAVLRDEASTISQSILNDIKLRFEEINEKAFGLLSASFQMQDKGLKNKKTGFDVIFTKGFKTSSNNKKANLKSISDVDIAIIEEFEDIDQEEKFNKFADSIRKEGSYIIINSNVPNKNHWFIKRFFNIEESGVDGYFKITPKKVDGVVFTFTTYKDNHHLDKKTALKYSEYGNPDSPLYNPEYYYQDILGYVSEGSKGRIYRNWKPISVKDYNALDLPTYHGLDFGYSNDPNALIQVKAKGNRRYIRQLIYQKGMSNELLAERCIALKINKTEIFADSQEPKSIARLISLGVNAKPAIKGSDSVNDGIKHIQSLEVYYCEDSLNLIQEYEDYKWQLDANKEPTDRPEDDNNHLQDAFRYAETKRFRSQSVNYYE